jgi:hypothetical protein
LARDGSMWCLLHLSHCDARCRTARWKLRSVLASGAAMPGQIKAASFCFRSGGESCPMLS